MFDEAIFNEVLTYDGLDGDDSRECPYPFPHCNHIAGVTKYNAGYTGGFLNYNIPFEAEIFANADSEIWLAVVMPVAFQEDAASIELEQCDEDTGEWDHSVLTQNMHCLGSCDKYQLEYNELLLHNEIFSMSDGRVPGYLKYFLDDEKHLMVQVFIGLMDAEGVLNFSDLDIVEFKG